ncbi:hypothetical protein BBK14_23585 [Parafrankia soli]|uniref:Uncharacterized protein n=1 Tax=Parafrankia soli TaxID=2599596 RepID=A0A1S1PRL8_9ACTN|nr:hypothetical protein [Parafrankia soli]OHV23966.1 hypothetical protein BBK14_23585 [Parafrankia soli]
MHTSDLLAEVNGDENLADVVARYTHVRQTVHDLMLADLPSALGRSREGVDGDSFVDSAELDSLFSQVGDLLREREELLDSLRAAGVTIANARIAAGG